VARAKKSVRISTVGYYPARALFPPQEPQEVVSISDDDEVPAPKEVPILEEVPELEEDPVLVEEINEEEDEKWITSPAPAPALSPSPAPMSAS
jgi:hypothetical protein